MSDGREGIGLFLVVLYDFGAGAYFVVMPLSKILQIRLYQILLGWAPSPKNPAREFEF